MIRENGISILDGFLGNWADMERFHAKYYRGGYPRTVLCGLNPGRNGAGKTGIPFVDFSSLSKLLSGVKRTDTERSARFFFDIVSHFGAEPFFRSFYVTNVSWVGYSKHGKNLNYDLLPVDAIEFVSQQFIYEMSVVEPTHVISMSKSAHATVSRLLGKDVDTTLVLPHPSACMFPSKRDVSKAMYVETLSPFLHR
jgi:hypothetical protein